MSSRTSVRVVGLVLALSAAASAQPANLIPSAGRTCATLEPTIQEVEASVRVVEQTRVRAALRIEAEPVTVPVAFHIITDGLEGDVPDAQIEAQIDTLNSAFRDVGFRFALAFVQRVDNAEWYRDLRMGSDEEEAMTDALALDPARVLNIYTASLAFDFLGWATVPRAGAESDRGQGVVLLTGTLPGGTEAPYNLGHTGTHEVGHWVGLLHPFAGGCSATNDGVADTPQERSGASRCPTGRDSCPFDPGLDPIHNYMDYSDDACMTEFTPGQAERAQALTAEFRPTVTAGGYALATLAPGQADDVLVGVGTTVEVRVTNTTAAPFTVTSASSASGIVTLEAPVTITPGAAAVVGLEVDPARSGAFTAPVQLSTSNAALGPLQVLLTGQAFLPPTARLGRSGLEVRLIEDAGSEVVVALGNTGDGPLTFEIVEATLPAFVASVEPLSGTVAPRGEAELTISLSADDLPPADYLEAVEIATNDPVQGTVAVEVALDVLERPERLRVDAPFPNPSRGRAVSIPLALPQDASDVRAEVYDVRGRRVAVIAQGADLEAGYPSLRWDPAGVASGLYLVRVTAGVETALGRIVVSR